MATLNLVDKRAYLNVFGCLMLDGSLIEDIDRPLIREDFNTESFYELLYVAIYNLHMNGVQTIDEFAIDSYLSNFEEQYKLFRDNKGLDYLTNARDMAELANYDYYYHRLRKFSLLRYYEKKGLDTRYIYDTTVTEPKAAEIEQQKFENYTEQNIVEMVEADFVINPSMNYCTNTLTTEVQAASNLMDLVNGYMEIPDVGLPLANEGLNTVARGARNGCLFMRSAPSGGGKSRMLAGDACKFSVPWFYDVKNNEWVHTGISEPTLYITTEMEYEEIQTLILAAVSKVDEDHIISGAYAAGEYERVQQAAEYIEQSPLYIVHIPDFSIEDIKNIVKKYKREYGIEYFMFDYIHTSLRLMSEINSKSGMGLKEHQLLLVFATELKSLAQQLKVFIFTASQLNREAIDAKYKDQTLLAGATALANKLDAGIISIRPNKNEQRKLESAMKGMIGVPKPDMGHWVYKIRRGKLTKIVVWSKSDFGTMTEQALFVTDFDFNLIDVDFTKIEVMEEKIQENSVRITKDDIEKEVERQEEESSTPKFDW